MIRAVYFRCKLSKATADALNAESGRIYTQVLVEQYRVYRKKGIWLSPGAMERLNDCYNADGQPLLHAHSTDAAQQGFPKACKTTREARKAGIEDAHYPYKRKRFRTTVWKNTGIRRKGDVLLLSLARGHDPIYVLLPEHLRHLDASAFTEMRLVYSQSSRYYEWHLIVDDGIQVEPTAAQGIAAVDLGEVHPATLTDGHEALLVMGKELRSQKRYSNKRLSKLQQRQARHQRGSRRWKRLQQRKNRFLAKQDLVKRDIEHKLSREVVDWAVEHAIGKLFIGDVRDVADKTSKAKASEEGKRYKGEVHNQRLSQWTHGKLRRYVGYKAQTAGIAVDDAVPEHYTSQTCPQCRNRYKPSGRKYRCPVCGFCSHRDVVGASNILSRAVHGELGKVRPPERVKYRQPYLRVRPRRSPVDTRQVARASENCQCGRAAQEAAPL